MGLSLDLRILDVVSFTSINPEFDFFKAAKMTAGLLVSWESRANLSMVAIGIQPSSRPISSFKNLSLGRL
jgi:hypothetical protein